MYKTILFSIFLFVTFQVNGQHHFDEVDQFARDYRAKSKDYQELALDLTAPFDSPTDKARAIYVWITDNVKYDCKKLHKQGKNKTESFSYQTETERKQKIDEREISLANTAIKKKKGVCEDYAFLFQRMCSAVGIETEFVTGHLGGNSRNIGKIPRIFNHAWNSIKLDGIWYLVDATTGSGTSDANCKKFHKKFNSGLFMVNPEDMILSHFPDQPEWQYLPKPITKEEFSLLPVAGSSYYKFNVSDFEPKFAIIPANETKIATLKVKFTDRIDAPIKLFVNGKPQPGLFKLSSDGFWTYEYNLKNRRNKTMSILIKDGDSFYEILSYKSK